MASALNKNNSKIVMRDALMRNWRLEFSLVQQKTKMALKVQVGHSKYFFDFLMVHLILYNWNYV